jgi:hypothetical protein
MAAQGAEAIARGVRWRRIGEEGQAEGASKVALAFATPLTVILSEAKDLASASNSLRADARSFASLRIDGVDSRAHAFNTSALVGGPCRD